MVEEILDGFPVLRALVKDLNSPVRYREQNKKFYLKVLKLKLEYQELHLTVYYKYNFKDKENIVLRTRRIYADGIDELTAEIQMCEALLVHALWSKDTVAYDSLGQEQVYYSFQTLLNNKENGN